MVNTNAPSSLEMIERLIRFDTTSHLSNLELIDFVEDYLRGHGAACERIVSEDGRKANLWATLGNAESGGGVVLSGHSDVVPVAGQEWRSDPFRAVVRDGRLYGRGSCDMKSFIAIALACVPKFLAQPLARPIHFAISYDEEVGCLGVRPMLSHIAARYPPGAQSARPSCVIIGEPTSMRVVTAHKGIRAHETRIIGQEAHSSAPDKGVSAIMAAARLIGFLERLGAEERCAAADAFAQRFDPPCASVQVGKIDGGEAINIIPRHCRFGWEYRALPRSDEAEILRRFRAYAEDEVLPPMRRISAEASIETEVLAAVPAFAAEENSQAEQLALRLSGGNRVYAASYATEAGLFAEADMSAVVCGPGDIAQAHRPDEFIALEQIAACEKFLSRLAEHLRA